MYIMSAEGIVVPIKKSANERSKVYINMLGYFDKFYDYRVLCRFQYANVNCYILKVLQYLY